MKGIIYMHTCPNGKRYIGQTIRTNPNIRWANGHGYAGYFGNAIKKYGWDNIKHEILEEIEFNDIKELNQLEENYIIKYNTLHPNGYNLKTGGKNFIRTPEHNEHIAQGIRKTRADRDRTFKLRGCNKGPRNGMFGKPAHNRGKKASKEIIEKNRLAHIGKHNSQESRLKCSKSISNLIWITDGTICRRINKNLPLPDGYHYGRIYSKDGMNSMKKKLSIRMKGNTYGKGRLGCLNPSYKYIEKQVIDSIINDYKYIKDGIKEYRITLYTFNRAYEEYYGKRYKNREK